jgi:5-dehydro-2-deoxygluconokinase
MPAERLDLIAIGSAAVEFHGEQIGSRLEDMTSFAMHLGGGAARVAVGLARLGLDVGVLTRVGDEPMGRFLRETLAAEHVDVSLVKSDPRRATALILRGVKDEGNSTYLPFRAACADLGIEAGDCDPEIFARAGAILVSASHMAHAGPGEAARRAIALARSYGARVILDIDQDRAALATPGSDAGLAAQLQDILPLCDLVVGTEAELRAVGGAAETMAALHRLRELTRALLVVKRGPAGCAVFPDTIATSFDAAIRGPGFVAGMVDAAGAGDAFLSGFLAGWLRGETLETCARWADAGFALVAARHAGAAAMATRSEMLAFIARADEQGQPRLDAALAHQHHATTRRGLWDELCVLAVDHRVQFEELAHRHGRGADWATRFKAMCCDIVEQRAHTQPEGQFGLILDAQHGTPLLHRMTGRAAWLARCVELPRSRPLQFVGGPDIGTTLRSWPAQQVVKCLVSYHADDPPGIRAAQDAQILRLYDACRATSHELLLEIVPPEGAQVGAGEWRRTLQAIYDLGVKPDWWKLPGPLDDTVWDAYEGAIGANDRFCRGVLLLGLDAPLPEIVRQFAAAAGRRLCRGFAIGRTIWWDAAARWFAGEIDDATARLEIERRYDVLVAAWRRVP